MSQLHRPHRQATFSITRVVPSRLEEVDGLCAEAKDMLLHHGLALFCFPVDLLTREFMNNAILHGNRRDPGKMVTFMLKIARKWISLTIADEGQGFRWRKARRTRAEETDTSGRGLSIGALYANHMVFNRSGNKVTLWLKRYKEE